jgi:electron transfer flavoprotein-quinone oxidoreductase
MACSRTEYDVIVVGAGPGGAAAALQLARKGVNVLMLEKGQIPGEKNMTGGVLYGGYVGDFGLINLVPGFERSAPLQRRISSHEVVFLGDPDKKTGTFRYYRLTKSSLPSKLGLVNMDFDTGHDYAVLRRPFDRWFANLAVEEGAMLSTGTTVEDLLIENGSVVGVRTSKEEIRSHVVIDCSGVTSTLVEKAGLRDKLTPRQLYHGTKRIYKLDSAAIEKRFKLKPGEGRAVFFLGSFMNGVSGGAFIYTNNDSLSVGVVASLDSLIRATTEHFDKVGKLLDVQDELEKHPLIAEILEGAQPVEYAAHNIPKGYKSVLKKPYTDGYMATGDALGAFVKVGPMIDGVRRAVATGIMAARAYLEASSSGSFKSRNLAHYRDLLVPIYEDVNRSGRDSFLSESSTAYHTLPKLIFGTRFMTSSRSLPAKTAPEEASKDAMQRVQDGTSLLTYDEDSEYSHIKVDLPLASKSITKPWIPACPVNCYTLLTPKGVFASYKDLYEHNLSQILQERSGQAGDAKRKAFRQTLDDVAAGSLRFDHVACVSCGTCGAIGPKEMVLFTNEIGGHGVRYKFG